MHLLVVKWGPVTMARRFLGSRMC